MASSQCASQGTCTEFEAEFGTMLKPIKDLNKNWEIDLVKLLEKYLEQFIQRSGSSLESGILNFAQAAMLIQGSAHIYSKKVEYVHSLTFQLYEQMVTENKKKKKQQLPESERNGDGDTDVSASIHEQFLSLDDISASLNLCKGSTERNSSFRSTKNVVPTALLMLDDQEKGTSMLINIKGSQMGNRNDTSLNRCFLSASGTLLGSPKDELMVNIGRLSGPATTVPLATILQSHQDVENDDDMFDAGVADPDPVEEVLPPPEIPKSMEKRQTEKKVTAVVNFQLELNLDSLKTYEPHEETKGSKRPLKEMCVYRTPSRLINTPSKKRKRDEVKDIKKVGFENMALFDPILLDKICFSHVDKFPKNPLKVPLFESVNDEFWQRRKVHQKQLQEMRKLRLQANMRHVNDEESDDDQENNEPFENPGDLRSHSDEEDLLDLPINQNARLSGNHDEEDIFESNQVALPMLTTYEELAKEQVAKFYEANARFHKGNDMGKRVNEWEERIQPYLEEEENRRPYDIQTYGSEILDYFGDNNRKQTLPFAEIVRDKVLWEIPRYFLSSLFLANHYNVEISANGILEEGMDSMELTLLSRKRHHEKLLEEDFGGHPSND